MRASAWLLILLCGCASTSGSNPGGDADTAKKLAATAPGDEPTRAGLFRIVLGLAEMPLRDGAHCDGVMDDSDTADVGDWLAYNLALMKNGAIELPTRCERESESWRCVLEFSVQNPEEEVFWKWGVRIDVRGGAYVPGSLMCTGSG